MGIVSFLVPIFFAFFSIADDRDVSDFAWNRVKVIKGNRDVVNWRETKRIGSVTFSKRGICFDKPLWEQWPHVPGHAVFPEWDASPVAGTVHVIAKFGGSYYSGHWDYLVKGHGSCKLGHAGAINNAQGGKTHMENPRKLYHELGADQVRVAPMDVNWVIKPGDVVGFYVAAIDQSNVRERSGVYWYRVPAFDGTGGAAVSGGGDGTAVASPPPANGACGTDRPAPHWKTIGGKCLPSCGHAGNLYCKSNDCSVLSLSRRCRQGDVALESHERRPCCLVGKGTSSASSPTTAGAAPIDCETLRTQIPELQRRLDEQMKAYRGRRQKKWLGLKRNSCKNVGLCESLARTIHLAQGNPSMASRLDHYKKQFGKNCKDFERCRAIAGEIEQIKKELNEGVRAYNKNCRS